MSQPQTVELLARARQGSEAALNDLFQRYAGKLLTLIRLRMGPSLRARLESRDILQASLLKAFAGLEQAQGEDGTSLMAWLAAIAENEIRDQAAYHRRQRRDVGREVPLEGEGTPPLARRVRSALSRMVAGEEEQRLERALESLTAQHREVILLRKLEELTYPEIARRLGKSPDACRMLYARAMTALTLILEEGDAGGGTPHEGGAEAP